MNWELMSPRTATSPPQRGRPDSGQEPEGGSGLTTVKRPVSRYRSPDSVGNCPGFLDNHFRSQPLHPFNGSLGIITVQCSIDNRLSFRQQRGEECSVSVCLGPGRLHFSMQRLGTLDPGSHVSINAFEKFKLASRTRPSNFANACRTGFKVFSSTIAATEGPLPDSPAPSAPASIAESAGRGSSPRMDATASPLSVSASPTWPLLASP